MKSMLKSLMSVAAAALALTSCSNDATEDVMPNGGTKTLEVSATIDQTRTVMAADHVNLNWTDNDEIYLYIGNTATEHHPIKPKTGGTITGVDYKEGDMVYANYSEGNSYSTGVKSAEIYIVKDQSQTEANVFAGNNLPMVAQGTIKDGHVDLVFQPVGCVLVFNVYGPVENETIKSIKFETSETCCGYYNKCDLTAGLTAETLGYKQSVLVGGGKTITVTLDTPAAIGASKPTDTKKGENQVYMVVAPFNYPVGSKFIVTTEAGKTYTFTTKNGIDCSAKTARVVNLNLKNAAEMQPSIIVPTEVPLQSSVVAGQLSIEGIEFLNLTKDQVTGASVSAYSDAEHTQKVDWVTFDNAELSENGILHYSLTANENEAERTAYIVIECGDVKSSAIAVTQLGKGKFAATYVPANMNYENKTAIPNSAELNNGDVELAFDKNSGTAPAYYDPAVRCYKNNKITVKSTSSKILKIEIVRNNTSNVATLSANVGTLSNNNNTYTWTGESENVVLTLGSSGQFHVESMTIVYGEDNEPKIVVPDTIEKQPAEGGTLTIPNIVLKNFAADQVAQATAVVYSNAELTEQENVNWLTIDVSATDLSIGTVVCNVAENTTAAERTAYIGIECGGVKSPAIAVTQSGKIAPPAPGTILLEENFKGVSGNNTTTGGSNSAWSISSNFSAATKVYQAGEAIRIGAKSSPGSITTKELNLLAPTTLEFKVKGWTSVLGQIKISVDGKEINVNDAVTYTATMSEEFEQKTVQLDAATGTSTITISTTKSVFFDDIVVKVTEQQ